MILIKCCDISNEVRPMEVAEPWVDCLLEEYFMQVRMREQCSRTMGCCGRIPPQLWVFSCLTAWASSGPERLLLWKAREAGQQDKLFRKQMNATDCNSWRKDNTLLAHCICSFFLKNAISLCLIVLATQKKVPTGQ